MNDILVPISPGELIDKLTILRIKAERITDAAKYQNVAYERTLLQDVADNRLPSSVELNSFTEDLYDINCELWNIEDDIRECESRHDFGEKFIALARAVYQTNDRRAAVKKSINLLLGSAIVEEKSYYEFGYDN